MVTNSVGQSSTNGTMFQPLTQESIGISSFLWGGVLSLIIYGGILLALGQGAHRIKYAHSLFVPDPQRTEGTRKPRPEVILSCEFSGNQSSKVTVVVHPGEGDPTPTGNVNLLSGWKQFKEEKLLGGTATVTVSLSSRIHLPIRAVYLGDSNYGSATSVRTEDHQNQDSCSGK